MFLEWSQKNSNPHQTRETGVQRKNGDHPDHHTGKIKLEYLKEFWRPEEVCIHLDTSEKSPVIIIIIILLRSFFHTSISW